MKQDVYIQQRKNELLYVWFNQFYFKYQMIAIS